MPQLVIGLGNPGDRYARTRHNVGFRVVGALAAGLGATFRPADPAYHEARAAGPAGPVVLLAPRTYMNRSGDALLAWAARETVAFAELELLVVCDDLHLPLGSLRLRGTGSDGGQNGLASVLDVVGHREVPRLRLGVGPLTGDVPPERWADHVLEDFAAAEEPAVAEMVERAATALLDALAHGVAAAASRHNRRVRPPESPDDETLPEPG